MDEQICNMCLEGAAVHVTLDCGHLFCESDLLVWFALMQSRNPMDCDPTCPICLVRSQMRTWLSEGQPLLAEPGRPDPQDEAEEVEVEVEVEVDDDVEQIQQIRQVQLIQPVQTVQPVQPVQPVQQVEDAIHREPQKILIHRGRGQHISYLVLFMDGTTCEETSAWISRNQPSLLEAYRRKAHSRNQANYAARLRSRQRIGR